MGPHDAVTVGLVLLLPPVRVPWPWPSLCATASSWLESASDLPWIVALLVIWTETCVGYPDASTGPIDAGSHYGRLSDTWMLV